MANRAKRIALATKKENTAQLLRQLYKESELRESDRRYCRSLQRVKNREYLRLLRRGLPDWVISNAASIELLSRVAEFKSNWIRTLKRFPWEQRIHLGDLERVLPAYLFAKYPVPEFMGAAFGEGSSLERSWYVHVGMGKNIRTAKGLPFPMTKKMAHYFLQSPEFFSVYKSLRYAQVLGYGGSEKLARSITMSAMDFEPERARFWAEVIQWMINQGPIRDEHVKSIIIYIQNQKFKKLWVVFNERDSTSYAVPSDPEFSIKGRKLRKFLREVPEWLDCYIMGERISREFTIAKDINDLRYFTGGGKNPRIKYEIRPLLSMEEIIEEGRQMRHCVGTYLKGSFLFNTSIWSLTRTPSASGRPQRLLTLEVFQDRKINEARGKMNRLATDFERKLVRRWASQEGLSWAENEQVL